MDKDDLVAMLRKWGKACFICDIEGQANALSDGKNTML